MTHPIEVNLTPQQRRVLELLCEGKSSAEICASLRITRNTLRNYVSPILHAFNVRHRYQVVAAVLRHHRKE